MKDNELIAQKKNFYLHLSKVGQGGLALAFLLGVSAFIGGMAIGEETRTWGSLLFNLMFFFSLSVGGVAFGNMQDIIGALWGRPVKRIHETFGAFLPWCGVFFLFYLCSIRLDFLNAREIYSWVADPHLLDHFHGKNIWLQLDFMIIRDLVAIAIIVFLGHQHLKLTTKGDLSLMKGDEAKAEQEAEKTRSWLRYWSSPILFVYAMCFSLVCFDLTMSLAPTWFSTLWGGWSFSIMMQTLLALLLIIMFMLKDTPIGQFIRRDQFHDIGKLLFGFTVFYAYLTFAHVLTYWYGNVPEETSYFITRLEAPWVYFIIAAPFTSFIFPFFALIPKVSKWSAFITIPVCVVVLVAQWINYMLIVIPETVKGDWFVPWIEVGLFLGFFGMFVFSIFQFGKKVPMLSISDPLLHKSLHDGH